MRAGRLRGERGRIWRFLAARRRVLVTCSSFVVFTVICIQAIIELDFRNGWGNAIFSAALLWVSVVVAFYEPATDRRLMLAFILSLLTLYPSYYALWHSTGTLFRFSFGLGLLYLSLMISKIKNQNTERKVTKRFPYIKDSKR
jgi:hypothetical protein